MYESPVNIVYNQMQTEVDNYIFKAMVNVGVDVNKEELIKAMQYDRGQYEKGYKDGYEDGQIEFGRKLVNAIGAIKLYDFNYETITKLIDNLVKGMDGGAEND